MSPRSLADAPLFDRSIARLGLSNIDESWTTAFSSRLVLQNLRRRRQMQDALRVWRTLIELSSVGLEHSPYETLRNQASRSEDLSRNVKSLWSQVSDLLSSISLRADKTLNSFRTCTAFVCSAWIQKTSHL